MVVVSKATAIVLATLGLLTSACASTGSVPKSSFMATGDVADAPSGFTSMCTREPQDCAPVGPVEDQAPVRLTQQRWALVQHVNRDANTRIRPLSDELNYGVPERWVDPLAGHLQDSRYTAAGDCEDFALAKRDLLLAAGWPAGAMFVAVGYHMTLGPHAVLVVRTDRGDLVLDSRTPWISA